MDAKPFIQMEQEVRHNLNAEQLVRIELAARESNSLHAIEALLGAKTVSLDENRLCPICGSDGTVKNGRDRRNMQRFICRSPNCRHSFTALTNTFLSGMHMLDKCVDFAQSLVDHRSLDWVHEHLGISRKTGFAWRIRFLGSAAELPADPLGGIIEADEAFFLDSFKGSRGWKTGNPPANRPPRYRGSGALQPGLSFEQVQVVTALDRNEHIVQGVLVDRSDDAICTMLSKQIEQNSIICSDGRTAYPKLADATSCDHHLFERPIHTLEDKTHGLSKGRPGALGLGRVNSYHEGLKTLINRIYRGVSTRLLPNYLALMRHIRTKLAPIAFIKTAIA